MKKIFLLLFLCFLSLSAQDKKVLKPYSYVKESNNKIELGDYDGLINGTFMKMDDANRTIELNSSFGVAQLQLDGFNETAELCGNVSIRLNAGANRGLFMFQNVYSLGDIESVNNETKIVVDDINMNIKMFLGNDYFKLDRHNSIYAIGDYNLNSSGTAIVVDDGNEKIDIAANYITLGRSEAGKTFIKGNLILENKSANVNLSATEGSYYMKGSKFIVSYNDAGTVKYRYMDLTSTNANWTYTTTAP